MRGVAEGFEFFLLPGPKGHGDRGFAGSFDCFDCFDFFDFRGQKSQWNQWPLIFNQRSGNQSGALPGSRPREKKKSRLMGAQAPISSFFGNLLPLKVADKERTAIP